MRIGCIDEAGGPPV